MCPQPLPVRHYFKSLPYAILFKFLTYAPLFKFLTCIVNSHNVHEMKSIQIIDQRKQVNINTFAQLKKLEVVIYITIAIIVPSHVQKKGRDSSRPYTKRIKIQQKLRKTKLTIDLIKLNISYKIKFSTRVLNPYLCATTLNLFPMQYYLNFLPMRHYLNFLHV